MILKSIITEGILVKSDKDTTCIINDADFLKENLEMVTCSKKLQLP